MSEEKQARSWRGRIFSLESLLGLAGLGLVAGGIFAGHVMAVFWGVATIAGLLVLHRMRKKDWQAHWDEKNRKFPPRKNDR